MQWWEWCWMDRTIYIFLALSLRCVHAQCRTGNVMQCLAGSKCPPSGLQGWSAQIGHQIRNPAFVWSTDLTTSAQVVSLITSKNWWWRDLKQKEVNEKCLIIWPPSAYRIHQHKLCFLRQMFFKNLPKMATLSLFINPIMFFCFFFSVSRKAYQGC